MNPKEITSEARRKIVKAGRLHGIPSVEREIDAIIQTCIEKAIAVRHGRIERGGKTCIEKATWEMKLTTDCHHARSTMADRDSRSSCSGLIVSLPCAEVNPPQIRDQRSIFLCEISMIEDLYRFDFGDSVVYATFVEAIRLLRELQRLRPRQQQQPTSKSLDQTATP